MEQPTGSGDDAIRRRNEEDSILARCAKKTDLPDTRRVEGGQAVNRSQLVVVADSREQRKEAKTRVSPLLTSFRSSAETYTVQGWRRKEAGRRKREEREMTGDTCLMPQSGSPLTHPDLPP